MKDIMSAEGRRAVVFFLCLKATRIQPLRVVKIKELPWDPITDIHPSKKEFDSVVPTKSQGKPVNK
jgi:hypothetical protein